MATFKDGIRLAQRKHEYSMGNVCLSHFKLLLHGRLYTRVIPHHVEVNLRRDISCLRIFYSKCRTRKRSTLKMKITVTECNIRCGVKRWKTLKSIPVVFRFFSLALAISEMLTFLNRDLENLGQGSGVQHLNDAIFNCLKWHVFSHWRSREFCQTFVR